MSSLAAELCRHFEKDAQENALLAPYTSARIGGAADLLLTARSLDALRQAAQICWAHGQGFTLLGAGSNLLVSDKGIRGVVILNRAKRQEIRPGAEPAIWAESGASFSSLARAAAAQAFTGLEWAVTIPGTVGGAVYGNAGAFGGEVATDLLWAEALTRQGEQRLSPAQMGYAYRSSALKRAETPALLLAAQFRLAPGDPAQIQSKMEEFTRRRKASQPPGASMGSMFKNPPGDYAGRLIEAAGLKGKRLGNAQISPIHANFFVNLGNATAQDLRELIFLTQQTVQQQFNVKLETEVEMVGEW
jgi:UDP-N-acetylmuramate dehydrogenase